MVGGRVHDDIVGEHDDDTVDEGSSWLYTM